MTINCGRCNITIQSDYGFNVEMNVRKEIEVISELIDDNKTITENLKESETMSRHQELVAEQLYFAQDLIANIQKNINRLPRKPSKKDLADCINAVYSCIGDSLFEQ